MHDADPAPADTPSKAFAKLKSLFDGTEYAQQASPVFAHLKEVAEYAKRFKVTSKLYINPLSSFRENFYKGGILFTCQFDRKNKDVFAAGGRYDHLIREHRITKPGSSEEERHAVGFSLAWEKIAHIQKTGGKYLKKNDDRGSGFFQRRVGCCYCCCSTLELWLTDVLFSLLLAVRRACGELQLGHPALDRYRYR